MNPDPYRGIWGGKHCRDSPIQTTRTCNCSPGKCEASAKYVDQLEEVLRYSAPKGRIGGFFAESIQVFPPKKFFLLNYSINIDLDLMSKGVGGTVQYPKGYLKSAFELIRNYGGVCISDEVWTDLELFKQHPNNQKMGILLGSKWVRPYRRTFLGF